MQTKELNRYAGPAGILSALLYIVSIVGMQYYLATELADVAAFTQNMNDSHFMMLMYGWPGLMATLLIIPLVKAFHQSNKRHQELSRMFYLITVIGLVFVLVGYMLHLALTYFHAPMFHTLTGEQQAVFAAVFKTTIGIQDMFWLCGDLFAFLGIAAILLLSIKEGAFPWWLLTPAVVAGTLAAFGSLGFIPAYKSFSWLGQSFIIGFSIFAIWEIAAGIYLIKKAKS